ncbi:aminotransferase [Bryobacterales bacterium F-183]|nr:aminotransferase [Bryobacterales bacterium F-183]
MILANDFQRQWADAGADVLAAVTEVGESGWYVLGKQVAGFEAALAQYWGLPHAVGVANGLDAIEMSLRALGCGPGDFVLTSPISAFATALAIIKLGATPVFADCAANGLVDLDDCREILSKRPEIHYFVPVHLYGHCLDITKLEALRDEFGVQIVEDCAQSIGTACGRVGQLAATSFYPTKNLGALGDGGAVLCRSDELAAKVRQLRDYGQSRKYVHDVAGYNSRLDELQAAVLLKTFLPRLAGWTKRRQAIAAAYRAGLSNPRITVPEAPADSVWHLFPVLVEGPKTEALAYFRAAGIGVAEHYPQALIEQPALGATFDRKGCERAKQFCRQQMSLPIHPYLTDEEVQKVIEVANSWRG